MSHGQATAIERLTPPKWSAKDAQCARTALQCLIDGSALRAQDHIAMMSQAARADLNEYVLPQFAAYNRAGLELSPDDGTRHESIHTGLPGCAHCRSAVLAGRPLVPCGRCGHAEMVHWSAGPARRGCGECATGNCEPRRVPVGVAQTEVA